MSVCRWVWLAILAFLAVPAGAVTPQQVRELPVAELARLVLGEAGAVVEDVDRPEQQTCMFGCGSLTEEQRAQAPLLSNVITFYTRAFPAGSLEWRGLCEVQLISVYLDESGKVSGIRMEKRWGVPHRMERAVAYTSPEALKARSAAEAERCRTGADVRTFFTADEGHDTAHRAVVAAELFAEAAGRGSPLTFKFKCKSDFMECEQGKGAMTAAAQFQPANIKRVEQVDCADGHSKLIKLAAEACYRVELKDVGEGVLVELADLFTVPRIKRLEYQHGMVIVD
jgi:hypothetical protein